MTNTNSSSDCRFTNRMLISLLTMTWLVAGCSSTGSHGSAPGAPREIGIPAAGKAKVVFMRPSSEGKAVNFAVHDGDRLIGKAVSSTYFVYECDPGQHVFSSSFGNLALVNADLGPNRIYYVNVRGQLRAFGPVWVKFEPLFPGGAAIKWEKIPGTLAKLKETTVSKAEVEHDLTGIEKYKERLKMYQNDAQPDERILPDYGQTTPMQLP